MRPIDKNSLLFSLTLVLFSIFILASVEGAVNHKNAQGEGTRPFKALKSYSRSEIYRICAKDIVEIFSPVEKSEQKTMILANSLSFELLEGQLYSKQKMEVNPSGEIDLPLVGSLKIEFLTLHEANALITQSMQKYYKHPRMFLKILEYRGYDLKQRIALMGEVNAPGIYPFQQTTNVLEALSFAGGPKNSANLAEVVVIRKGYLDKPDFLKVNVSDLLGGKISNMQLEGGDIVYVPRNFIGEIGNFVELFVSRIRPVAQTYLDFYYAIYAKDTLAKKSF